MKKKLISFVIAVCSIVLLLTVSAFALEEGQTPGENYDTSDLPCYGSGGCTYGEGCPNCSAYDSGYIDGRADGDAYYKDYYSPEEKDEAVAEETANILDEFLESEEFKALLQSAKDGAVQDYKDNEGQAAIDAAFDEGHESGYNSGYDAGAATVDYVYKKGYADGQANFRGSELYATELTEYFTNGFYLAFDEAYLDGYNEGVKYQINPGQIVALILVLLLIAVLFVVFSVVMYKTRKKRKGKKR